MKTQQAHDNFDNYLSRVRSEATAKQYRSCIGRFFRYLDVSGIDDLLNLSIPDLIGYLDDLAGEGYAKRSMTVHVSSVNLFIRWAMSRSVIDMDQIDYIKWEAAVSDMSRTREAPLPKIVEHHVISEVMQASSYYAKTPDRERAQAIVSVLYSTGCRVEELANLKAVDIDFDTQVVKIIAGKGKKDRFIFIDRFALDVLANYWNLVAGGEQLLTASSPAIWPTNNIDIEKKISTQTIRNIIADLCQLSGFKPGTVTPHSFRHDFATRMLAFMDIVDVQKLLGHASVATTQVYAKVSDEKLKTKYIEAFDSEAPPFDYAQGASSPPLSGRVQQEDNWSDWEAW